MNGGFRAHKVLVNGAGLGPLEAKLMDKLWQGGPGKVRDVMAQLDGPMLAYTTVMTTLNRLCAKGLLEREKSGLAFVYKPACSRQQWDRASAEDSLAPYLNKPRGRVELLISCLIEAAGAEDPAILDEMERKIQAKRL